MNPSSPARCQVVPLPESQVSVQIDGVERLRWHFGRDYPRPFFYPLVGPSGNSLVRMGHPGAPNHDHHRGIWFAHQDLAGNNFWSDQTPARIEQLGWLAYEDGDREARLAVKLGWFDGHDPQSLLEQTLVAAVRPADTNETLVEIDATFATRHQQLEFRKSNFGLLGVRVAKGISGYFGGGTITNSEGRHGEEEIFGQPARWVDYSGTVGTRGNSALEGITYIDHPDNPGYPSRWHVREDGWMIASTCMDQARGVSPDAPLRVRFLLHAHRDAVRAERADALAGSFAATRGMRVLKSTRQHTAWEIERE